MARNETAWPVPPMGGRARWIPLSRALIEKLNGVACEYGAPTLAS